MPGRGWLGAPPPQPGFQRHHLIPIALLHRGQMAAMFDHLQSRQAMHCTAARIRAIVTSSRRGSRAFASISRSTRRRIRVLRGGRR